jgi:hypothetical protein
MTIGRITGIAVVLILLLGWVGLYITVHKQDAAELAATGPEYRRYVADRDACARQVGLPREHKPYDPVPTSAYAAWRACMIQYGHKAADLGQP